MMASDAAPSILPGDLLDLYRERTPTSHALYERAKRTLPYGITRDPVWRAPYPIYAEHGEGAYLVDVDGHRYLDWWNNATTLALGHAHPDVVAAVTDRASRGLSFAAPTELEVALGERILTRLPAAERIRFTNSGTEAVMLALHLARAATGRSACIKFEGAYHGFYDAVSLSVAPQAQAAGPPDRPRAVIESRGVTRATTDETTVLPWNDLAAVTRELEERGSIYAAILVEPVANKQGVIPPESGYLEGLRELADRYDICLIFDEVIAFRVGWGGAQERYGVRPDLTTLGKLIGGGLPVGAVAGRWETLAHLTHGARSGVVHMGTFNANPMTMTSGIATLDRLDRTAYRHLDGLGERVRSGLRQLFERSGTPWQVTGVGSLFKIHLHDRPIRNYRDTLPRARDAELELTTRLLLRGHMLPYNVAGAATLPMTPEDVDALVASVATAAEEMGAMGRGVEGTS